jgi:hypothetical protein
MGRLFSYKIHPIMNPLTDILIAALSTGDIAILK